MAELKNVMETLYYQQWPYHYISTASEKSDSLILEALDCLQTTTIKHHYLEPPVKQKKKTR